MLNLPNHVEAVAAKPADGPRRLALAGWLATHGSPDEAAAVRVFWPTLRDFVIDDRLTVGVVFDEVSQSARMLGRLALAPPEAT